VISEKNFLWRRRAEVSRRLRFRVAFACFAIGVVMSCEAGAADATAAHKLAQDSNCYKCHSATKKKEGPSWRELAEKHKDKDDGEAKMLQYLTSTTRRAKFADGHEEDHPVVKSKDQEQIKNLALWLLGR